jgi:hypothetical protein
MKDITLEVDGVEIPVRGRIEITYQDPYDTQDLHMVFNAHGLTSDVYVRGESELLTTGYDFWNELIERTR